MPAPRHPLAAPVVNAVVLRVTDRLETLLWLRPDGPWSLPGGFVREGESLDDATRRHLASKVGVTDVGHLEQLDTRASADTHPELWLLDTAYLALVPPGAQGELPPDTAWHPVAALPPIAFGHEGAVHRAHERLRGKLSYSNVAFALAPPRFTLRELAAHQPRPRPGPRRHPRRDRRDPGARRQRGRAARRRVRLHERGARRVPAAGGLQATGVSSRDRSSTGAECVSAPIEM